MKRLAHQTDKNSPEEYDRIFSERQKKGIDPQDKLRWQTLLKYYKGGNLVDLGCLDSLIPELAHQRDKKSEIWGIDLASGAIESMRRLYPYIYYTVADVYDTKFPPNYFQYATAGELIEHLDDPQKFFDEATRILKHGGTLAISTPFEEEHEPGAVDGERHLWSFSKDDIINLWAPHGTVRFQSLGSQWFPYYVYHFPTLIAYCRKT